MAISLRRRQDGQQPYNYYSMTRRTFTLITCPPTLHTRAHAPTLFDTFIRHDFLRCSHKHTRTHTNTHTHKHSHTQNNNNMSKRISTPIARLTLDHGAASAHTESTIATSAEPFVATVTRTIDWVACNVPDCRAYVYKKGEFHSFTQNHGEHCDQLDANYVHKKALKKQKAWTKACKTAAPLEVARKAKKKRSARTPKKKRRKNKKPVLDEFNLAKPGAAHYFVEKPEKTPRFCQVHFSDVEDMFFNDGVGARFFFDAWGGVYAGHFYYFTVLDVTPSGQLRVGHCDKKGNLLHDGDGNIEWQCFRTGKCLFLTQNVFLREAAKKVPNPRTIPITGPKPAKKAPRVVMEDGRLFIDGVETPCEGGGGPSSVSKIAILGNVAKRELRLLNEHTEKVGKKRKHVPNRKYE